MSLEFCILCLGSWLLMAGLQIPPNDHHFRWRDLQSRQTTITLDGAICNPAKRPSLLMAGFAIPPNDHHSVKHESGLMIGDARSNSKS